MTYSSVSARRLVIICNGIHTAPCGTWSSLFPLPFHAVHWCASYPYSETFDLDSITSNSCNDSTASIEQSIEQLLQRIQMLNTQQCFLWGSKKLTDCIGGGNYWPTHFYAQCASSTCIMPTPSPLCPSHFWQAFAAYDWLTSFCLLETICLPIYTISTRAVNHKFVSTLQEALSNLFRPIQTVEERYSGNLAMSWWAAVRCDDHFYTLLQHQQQNFSYFTILPHSIASPVCFLFIVEWERDVEMIIVTKRELFCRR